MTDEILYEAIEVSGYWELKDVNWDDLPVEKRALLILATELSLLRPDLFLKHDPDVVFIIQRTFENGIVGCCSLPKKSLGELLKTPPYDDLVVCSYSLKDEKILQKIYKGTGTRWELIK